VPFNFFCPNKKICGTHEADVCFEKEAGRKLCLPISRIATQTNKKNKQNNGH
jgi:hypothetical protein